MLNAALLLTDSSKAGSTKSIRHLPNDFSVNSHAVEYCYNEGILLRVVRSSNTCSSFMAIMHAHTVNREAWKENQYYYMLATRTMNSIKLIFLGFLNLSSQLALRLFEFGQPGEGAMICSKCKLVA